VVVRRLETAGKWRSDERESVADERREMLLGYATVRTQARYTGAAEACDLLDL
jgi:hypothetical protein